MSQENVEIVRRGFMAVLDDDWPTALTTLHPEIEVRDFDIPDAGLYRGHEGFREWLSNWGEGWEEWRLDNIEFHSGSNGQVIALFRMITRARAAGSRSSATTPSSTDSTPARSSGWSTSIARTKHSKPPGCRSRRCRRRTSERYVTLSTRLSATGSTDCWHTSILRSSGRRPAGSLSRRCIGPRSCAPIPERAAGRV